MKQVNPTTSYRPISRGTTWLALLLCLILPLQPALAGKIIYYHNDASGSPVMASDAQGNIIWREHYTPYGKKLNNPVNEDIGYTGHEYDAETGLTYMQARYYDAEVGRFLAIDPVGFKPNQPMTFNRYSYANNNPYKYVDPDGREVTITIVRDTYTSESITSRMSVTSDKTDTSFNGFALEDTKAGDLGNKNPIESGKYDAFVRTDGPNGFRVELKGVENFTNVQIHVGNSVDDVIGCFAAGTERSENYVKNSQDAMDAIENIVKEDGTGEISVEVKGSNTSSNTGELNREIQ